MSTDPCGKVQYGIPNNSTEHQALAKVDYTINSNSSLFARYFYAVYDNPATYDGSNALTLSRTGQNNQAHSIVFGHNQVLSSSTLNSLHVTFNKTLNDRPLPQYFSATDLGAKVFSLVPGYVGISVTGNGFSIGNGGTNPGYFNSKSFQIADDVDMVRGNHQFSIGGNWIHSRIETLNNRPTNGAFTFNGQGTGLSLADFMVGMRQRRHDPGQPGLRQRPQRVRRRLRAGQLARPAEPDGQPRPALGAVPAGAEHRLLGEPLRAVAVRSERAQHGLSAGAGRPDVPRRRGLSGQRHVVEARWGSSRRASAWCGRRNGDERTSVRASWGVFYDTPHLFFNTRFANNPPWGAQITISESGRRLRRSVSRLSRAAIPFPALNTGWATQPFPAFGVYVNTPLDLKPTSLQQWNVSVQRQFGDWLVGASYLGNHSSHLWRATELNPAVFGPGATTANTNAAPRARSCRTRCRDSSTARSASSTTPAAPTTARCCCRCSAG